MARGVENYLLCTKDKSRRNQGNDNGFLDWPVKNPERIRMWGLGGGDEDKEWFLKRLIFYAGIFCEPLPVTWGQFASCKSLSCSKSYFVALMMTVRLKWSQEEMQVLYLLYNLFQWLPDAPLHLTPIQHHAQSLLSFPCKRGKDDFFGGYISCCWHRFLGMWTNGHDWALTFSLSLYKCYQIELISLLSLLFYVSSAPVDLSKF